MDITETVEWTKKQIKKENEKFKRIWKNYRWTKDMYLALGALQNWRCAGCGREAGIMPLNIDHEHFKIRAERRPDRTWIAKVSLKDGRYFEGYGPKKADAVNAVWELAIVASVRGLLCAGRYAGCNRKFGRIDDIPWLENMLRYVKDPPAKQLMRGFVNHLPGCLKSFGHPCFCNTKIE